MAVEIEAVVSCTSWICLVKQEQENVVVRYDCRPLNDEKKSLVVTFSIFKGKRGYLGKNL
jgi:hypothetical protein